MENILIKTRISIGKDKQGDIGFINEFNTLRSLNKEFTRSYNDRHFLDVDTIINYEGRNYRISSISTLFYESECGKNYVDNFGCFHCEYNFEIAYFVSEVE